MGWREIEERLDRRRKEGTVALLPYLTCGFPDADATLELVPAMEEAGADVVELGVPFSDPLADGVTIQRASFQSLQQGVTLASCVQTCAELRRRGVRVPIVLFGYYNPILSYGIQGLVGDAAAAGVDGFIVADLPGEESAPFREACESQGLCNIPVAGAHEHGGAGGACLRHGPGIRVLREPYGGDGSTERPAAGGQRACGCGAPAQLAARRGGIRGLPARARGGSQRLR